MVYGSRTMVWQEKYARLQVGDARMGPPCARRAAPSVCWSPWRLRCPVTSAGDVLPVVFTPSPLVQAAKARGEDSETFSRIYQGYEYAHVYEGGEPERYLPTWGRDPTRGLYWDGPQLTHAPSEVATLEQNSGAPGQNHAPTVP